MNPGWSVDQGPNDGQETGTTRSNLLRTTMNRGRMRTLPPALLLTAALLTGACNQVGQAVDRADRVADTARYCVQALELAQAVSDRDVDAAVEAGQELVEVAPPEVADDARTVLDAATRAQDGDAESLQSEEVVAAGQRLRATTERECSPGEGT